MRHEILDDLAAGRALSGDDQRIVIGRHQRGVAFVRDLLRDGLAVFARAVVEHDLGAQRRGALALGARRIRRHDDDRRHAEKPRRRRDALRVIARGKRHHAARALRRRDGGELVVGAAELERARALQGLGLEEHARAGQRIEHRRGQQRRA